VRANHSLYDITQICNATRAGERLCTTQNYRIAPGSFVLEVNLLENVEKKMERCFQQRGSVAIAADLLYLTGFSHC